MNIEGEELASCELLKRMGNKNCEAIEAANWLAGPKVFNHDKYSEYKTETDRKYHIVCQEHEMQISRIAIPRVDKIFKMELLPKEIIFLWYINRKPVSNPPIAVYWFIDYRIYDYQELISKLFSGGYLFSEKPCRCLSSYSIKSLKCILTDNSLPKSGDKNTLIQRIKANISESQINEYFKGSEFFALTPLGQAMVNDSMPLICFHQNRNKCLGIYRLDQIYSIYKKLPLSTPNDIVDLLNLIYKFAQKHKNIKNRNQLIEYISTRKSIDNK